MHLFDVKDSSVIESIKFSYITQTFLRKEVEFVNVK